VAGNILRFELSSLRLLGHLPSLDACAECGTAIEAQVESHLVSCPAAWLCARCPAWEEASRVDERAALRMLVKYASPAPQMDEWTAVY